MQFLAGLDASSRLLAVGSEWGSYAAPVSGSGARAGGSVARAALREVAEEAGERLARQGAKQAARQATENRLKAIVIGENMQRVRAAAQAVGAEYYRARRIIPWDERLAMRRNEAWLRRKIRQGYSVFDIGIDLSRTYRSPFYAMERRVLRELGVEPRPLYWPPSDNLGWFTHH